MGKGVIWWPSDIAVFFRLGTQEQEGEGWSWNLVSDIVSWTYLRDAQVESSSSQLNI